MLRIKYNNEFLDLAPDQDGELEANSPMFLIDNVLAEYSTPLNIVYTDKNARLIGPIFFAATVRKRQQFSVEIYKGDTYRCNATLIVESAGIRRTARKSNASGYLLTGISSFFSLLKDVMLQDMALGGDGKFFTTFLPYDSTNGYWQWLQSSWSGNLDFVVAPVRNDNLNGDSENPTEWINQIARRITGYSNSQPIYANFNDITIPQPGSITPMLKVKVAFEKIFQAVGWTLDSSALDSSWGKLIVFSTYRVDTFLYPSGLPAPSIGFDYADLLPTNTKASAFILALCKRYGWVPLCNAETKICTLLSLNNGDAGELKDWTAYADTDIDSDFTEDEKIYSFKNNFTGSDTAIDDKNISALTQTLNVASKFTLPAPSALYDNQAVYAYRENKWYGIDLDESNNRIWVPLKDNIYNDEPTGANAGVETDCSTLPMQWVQYTRDSNTQYWGLFPYCAQSRFADSGIRTLFYHGMVNEVKADGTTGLTTYPYLSSSRQGPDGTNLTEWSNVFKHVAADGIDSGIESFWYSKWISYMKYAEVKTQNFTLPLHVLVNYKWNDVILLNNIPHLIISFIEKLSQKGFIQAKLKRLIREESSVVVNSGIYVQFAWENVVSAPDITNFANGVLTGDLVMYCYSDAAGTVPATPNNLTVKFNWITSVDGVPTTVPGPPYSLLPLTGQRTTFSNDTVFGHNIKQFTVTALTPNQVDVFDVVLAPDAAYNIIP